MTNKLMPEVGKRYKTKAGYSVQHDATVSRIWLSKGQEFEVTDIQVQDNITKIFIKDSYGYMDLDFFQRFCEELPSNNPPLSKMETTDHIPDVGKKERDSLSVAKEELRERFQVVCNWPQNYEKLYYKLLKKAQNLLNALDDVGKTDKSLDDSNIPEKDGCGTKNEPEHYDLSAVTRLEIIDDNGRSYVNLHVKPMEFSYQDDGKTLKIFCGKKQVEAEKEIEEEKNDGLYGFMSPAQATLGGIKNLLKDKPKSIWKDVSELPEHKMIIRPYMKLQFTGETKCLSCGDIFAGEMEGHVCKKSLKEELEEMKERVEKKKEVDLEKLKEARRAINNNFHRSAIELIIEVLEGKGE